MTLQNVVARQFVDRIQAWIAEAEREAVEHLGRNQNRLDCLAEGLLQAETLHRPAILALLAMGTASDKK
jgi:ATP-dependent Zn protease